MKTGLVIEGGAKRGIYAAGVLDVFLENDISVDGVIGVSAGAIHGCSYVSKQKGRSIRYNMKYGNDYRFMSFRSFLKTGNIVDEKFGYHELPRVLDPYDNEAFMASQTKFYVGCSNVETGKAEQLLCVDMFKDIDYIRASASMPFVSKIVEVGGMKLLDGGITEAIALKSFVGLGYERNIVIQTRVAGYRKKPSFVARALAKLKYREYPNFIKAIYNWPYAYNACLDFVEEKQKAGEAFVIRPSKLIKISRMEQNLDKVMEMYDLGRSDALRGIENVKRFLLNGL